MKFIRSVKQCEGPGGTLETWQLNKDLFICFWKDEACYDIFVNDRADTLYTAYIFNLLNHAYNDIKMEFGYFMPPRIRMEHKYFDKFIQLVEKLSIEDLEPDEFSG